jgi:hypothetical protein
MNEPDRTTRVPRAELSAAIVPSLMPAPGLLGTLTVVLRPVRPDSDRTDDRISSRQDRSPFLHDAARARFAAVAPSEKPLIWPEHITATTGGQPAYSGKPDRGERRLGWIAVASAVVALMAVGAALSTLPLIRSAGDLSAPPPVTATAAVPDASPAPGGTPPTRSAATAPVRTGRPAAPVAAAGDVLAPSTVVATAVQPSRPPTRVRPGANATTAPAPVTGLPSDLQAAIATVRTTIQRQIDTGQLDRYAGADLLDKADQVARNLSRGDWAAALNYASKLWETLGNYRQDGKLTATGYKAIVSAVDQVRAALTTR